MNERKLGALGWIAIVGFVALWDILVPDTLTAAFTRGCDTRIGRIVVPAIWGITTAHLFGKIPRRADPFYVLTLASKNHLRVKSG